MNSSRGFLLKILKTFLILLLFIFIAPSKTLAAPNCAKDPEFKIGDIVTPFSDPGEDCSMEYFNTTTKVFREWLQFADVSCVRNPTLSPSFIGNLDDGVLFDEADGPGQVDTGFTPILPNIGINSSHTDSLHQSGDRSLDPGLKMTVGAYDQYNRGQIYAWCRSMGLEDDLDLCMQQFENCSLPPDENGNQQANDFCFESISRMTSLQDQFNLVKEQGREDIQCYNGTAPDDVHCQNQYSIGGNRTNVEVLKDWLPETADEYLGISGLVQRRLQAASQETKARSMVCIVVTPNIFADNKGGWLFDLSFAKGLLDMEFNETKIACGDAQGIIGAVSGLKQQLRIVNPIDKGEEALERIKQKSKTPGEDNLDIPPPPADSQYPGRDLALWNKVKKVGSACRGTTSIPKQFSGGNTKITPMGLLDTLLSFLNIDVDRLVNKQEEVNPYTLFIVSAGEFTQLEYLLAGDSESASNIFYPINHVEAFMDKSSRSDIPYYLEANEGKAEAEIGYYLEPEEQCYRDDQGQRVCETVMVEKPIKAKWNGGGKTDASIPGGTQATGFKINSLAQLLPLPEIGQRSNRVDDPCLYRGLSGMYSNLAGILGLDGGGDLAGSDSCPTDIVPTTTPISSEVGVCKQWLFENDSGGTPYYEKVIAAAKGAGINPYYAIAIALNENGGLISEAADGSSKYHFGCRTSQTQSIDEKISCMVGTISSRKGLPDVQVLKEYGYCCYYGEASCGGAEIPDDQCIAQQYDLGDFLNSLGNPDSSLFNSSLDSSILVSNLTSSGWNNIDAFSGNLPLLCPNTYGGGNI
ncbi:hypothetical protein ACFL1M_02550 [Patescibacteria group bacterium]